MWSQWVWLMNRCRVSGAPCAASTSERPSSRIPVPASKIRMSSPQRISTQDVLPPKPRVRGPGVAIDPRVPQKRTRMSRGSGGPGGAVPLDHLEQIVRAERLHDVVARAEGARAVHVGLVRLGGGNDHDGLRQLGMSADLLED